MIFLELVPRQLDTLKLEAEESLAQFGSLTGINIPDVLRIEVRSHDAAMHLAQTGITAIPHIRAIDRSVEETVAVVKNLWQVGVSSVLIVSGDLPLNPAIATYDVTPIEVISAIKAHVSGIKVYAALDPYRHSIKQELDYAHHKIEAGADGFFTQPFFDAELARIYLEQLTGTAVFLGISPVLGEKSLNYWKVRNHVVFPPSFEFTMDSQAELAISLLSMANRFNQHVYMMPITCPVDVYLQKVFERAS